MDRQSKAYAYAISAVLIWSTVASAFKISLRYVEPMQLLFYSSAISLIVLFGMLVAQGRLRELFSFSRKEYLYSAVLGLLNPFLYYVVLFEAYSRLQAQEAQPLNYTWAVALVLLSIPILKQKIGIRSIGAVFVSYIGVMVIATRGDLLGLNFTDGTGVALALVSTVIWALFWIYNVRDKREAVVKLTLVFSFGFIPIAIMTAMTTGFDFGGTEGLIGVAYVGAFEMGITFVLWLRALSLSRTTAQVSILIFISPFVSLFMIRAFVGETILLSTVMGLVLIVAGILFQRTDPVGKKKKGMRKKGK